MLIRNHELTPDDPGPYGANRTRMERVPVSKVYDAGERRTPASGGTTTLVYDTRRQRKLREFLSLAGTIRNCAGGPTPWGTWISCEETVDRAGMSFERKS